MRWLPSILLLLSLVPPQRISAQQIATRDSAGVRIVTVPGAMLANLREWRLATSPKMTLGGEGAVGPHQFDMVTSALRLTDGRVLVAEGLPSAGGGRRFVNGQLLGDEGQTGEVRVFDYDGRFEHKLGGPGGALKISSVPAVTLMSGENPILWDPGNLRLTFLSRAGEVVESRILDPKVCDTTFPRGACRVVGTKGTAAVVVREDPADIRAAGPATPNLPIVTPTRSFVGLFSVDGLTELDSISGGVRVRYWARPPADGSSGITSVAERAFNGWAVVTSGGERDDLAYGRTDRYEIFFRSGDRLSRILRVARPAAPVTAVDLEATRRRLYGAQLLDAAGAADSVPHFADLRIDDVGRLWVQDYDATGSGPRRWTIFDARGNPLARMSLPPGLRVFQIGSDFVLGAETVRPASRDGGVQTPAIHRVVMYFIQGIPAG